MGPTKSCGSYINLVGPMWFLTNQRECVKKCVLECVLLAFLLHAIVDVFFTSVDNWFCVQIKPFEFNLKIQFFLEES